MPLHAHTRQALEHADSVEADATAAVPGAVKQWQKSVDDACSALLTPRLKRALTHAQDPSFSCGKAYAHLWYRVHSNVYEKLHSACHNGRVFRVLQNDDALRELYIETSNNMFTSTSEHSVVRQLLRKTFSAGVGDDTRLKRLIPKVIHFWLLAAWALARVGQVAFDDTLVQWLQDESALVVKFLPDVDAIVAKLIFYLTEKAQVAAEYHVEYVSFLAHGHALWHVERFLDVALEADYAAAFESMLVPDEIHRPRSSVTSVRYNLERCSTLFVCAAFHAAALFRALQGLVSSGYDVGIAREMFNATVADYKAWNDDNVLLDNGRYRNVPDVECGRPIMDLSSMVDARARRVMAAYDRQGMLLYSRKPYPDSLRERVAQEQWIRYYGRVAARFHLIGPQLKVVLTRMASIKHTAGGGRVSASAVAMVVVWAYIALAVYISVMAAVANWGKRTSAFAKLADSTWILTTLLISVFGLVKLTSEDPNAIRHALSGRKALVNPRQVYEYLGVPLLDDALHWRDSLKGVVAAYPARIEWLTAHETSYCNSEPIGDIRLSGGLRLELLPAFMGLPGKGGIINVVLRKFRLTEPEIGTTWLYVKGEAPMLEVDLEENELKLG